MKGRLLVALLLSVSMLYAQTVSPTAGTAVIGGPSGTGTPGATGPAGPNVVTTSTSTTVSGVLAGDGSHVSQATPLVASCAANGANGVYIAACYVGADGSIQINACEVAAAAAEGICDARGILGNPAPTFSEQIEVLPNTALLLPQFALWKWDLRDGTSCGIQQDESSTIYGLSPGGAATMHLQSASNSTNMLALYCTEPTPGGGGAYLAVSGFAAENYAGGTFSHGVVYARNLFDQSLFERIRALNPTGDAMHILNVCCDTSFAEMAIASSYGAGGGTPLVVEAGGGSSFKLSGTVSGAGNSHPNIDIQTGNIEVDFPELYGETNGTSADTTTAFMNTAGAVIVRLLGGTINTASTKPCFNHPLSVVNLNVCSVGTTGPTNGNFVNGAGSDWYGIRDAQTPAYLQPGQIVAGSTSFIPATIGWYRVYSGGSLQGSFDILAQPVSTPTYEDIQGLVQTGLYDAPGGLTLESNGTMEGVTRVITQVGASTNNGTASYLDIYVSYISGYPIKVNFIGQGIDRAGIVAAPVVGSGPTTNTPYVLSLVDNGPLFQTTSSIAISSAQTVVNCSTSGYATFSQPQRGASFKEVVINLSSCIGTANYNYPTAFTQNLQVLSQYLASTATVVAMAGVLITGSGSSGSSGILIINGY